MKFTKTHALVILISFSVAFLYPIIIEGYSYFLDFIKGFLIGSIIGLIIIFRDLIKKETLHNKIQQKLKIDIERTQEIKEDHIENDTIEFTEEQTQLLVKFLESWFKSSTQENLQNLIDLNLPSIKGDLKLIKNPKSFSLLLFKLLEKKHYNKNQIESIFDCKKIIHINSKKLDKETFSKYHSDFIKGKSIDSDKQNQNIITLLKSF
ncbi:hypothetical protein LNI90_08630 [Tenacibaculum dicentrarchi]|uniref:hypothetical protein n=1 Tax=Tenacibaculum finnmarkense TaxID=2781243 RepID=UPI000C54C83A|nr:hypothetical protein [Tenacibaculum finnmarkense]MCD8414582.1 hypothetical protein [Tenacibaculum dicentrarchi]MBE7645381.1 hypothetical protein [Tenacibaculum finnmarkense genomovar ulcerans]MCD8419899.1 hypothetical protein [Tenacibaculum dicentrarchi]MCD8437091.1 hypothetical protein [Tenacibaculum dicentrarchi]MCD8438716.1 hypothetical protein [Tenacibaculum finnmarkense genomovar ulcerans]